MVLTLFDVDGTLLLSGGAATRAMDRAFEEVFGIAGAFAGIPMPGRTDPLIVSDAVEKWGLGDRVGEMDAFRERYFTHLAEELERPNPRKRVMPGIRELLDALAARPSVVLGLLTGNYFEAARLKLKHFGLWGYFVCGAYGDEAPTREALVPLARERALKARGGNLRGNQIFVIGDTPRDVACARSFGAVAVAVATGGYSPDALAAAGSDLLYESFADPAPFLEVIDRRTGEVKSGLSDED